jgi:hypothetical protein
MDPLVLRKPDGRLIPLLSLAPVLTGIDRAEQKIDLLTGDVFNLTISCNGPLPIGIGDTLAVYGQLYTLNTIPAARMLGEGQFVYELVLEGPQYHMLRVIYFDVDSTGNGLSSTFSLTGNLAMFAQVLISNLARVFSGAWGLGRVKIPGESTLNGLPGQVIDGILTEVKTLTFESENCLSVLQRLCAEWGTEFWIEYKPNDAPNRVLHIEPAGQTLPGVFTYGQWPGLYELARRPVAQTPFYTRAYIFGSGKNLPAGYRGFATRLQLPEDPNNPAGLFYPWDSYVEDAQAIATYGLIEGTKVFEEVYPSRTGTVSASTAQFTFSDTDIEFNPLQKEGSTVVGGNSVPNYKYLLPGLTPKVHFNTGNLAGYEFDITGFDPTTKTFTLKAYTDERGLVFPGKAADSPFRIQAGDTYVLVDMMMPQTYVTAAEEKLKLVGQAWLNENGAPAVEYTLVIDELFLQNKAGDTGPLSLAIPPNFFTVGDAIRLLDYGLGIDRMARIIGFTRDGLRPYKYTLTLGDTRKISLLQRAIATQVKVKSLIDTAGLNDPSQTPQTVKGEEVTKDDLINAVKAGVRPMAASAHFTLIGVTRPAGFSPAVLTGIRYRPT